VIADRIGKLSNWFQLQV